MEIMLHSFSVHNYKCIRDLTLDLSFAEGKAPNGYRDSPNHIFVEQADGKGRLCTTLALYGANASGKSTILEALEVLRLLISNGLGVGLYAPNRVIRNMLSEPTLFEVSFFKDRLKFTYTLSYAARGIIEERLTCNGKTLFAVEGSAVVDCPFKEKVQGTFAETCVSARTGNQIRTFLFQVAKALPGVSRELECARDFLLGDIVFRARNFVDASEGLELLSRCYDQTESEEPRRDRALKEITSMLHKLDFRIEGLRMEVKRLGDIWSRLPDDAQKKLQGEDPEKLLYRMETIHRAETGESAVFRLEDESEGTQKLVGLLGVVLAALHTGKVLVIDELDQSLHSLLVCQLVRLFKEKRTNKNNAQLICAAQNTDLLASGLLQLSEVGIVRQVGLEGASILRLAAVPELRNVSDFRKRYLRGDFGGIPFPCV